MLLVKMFQKKCWAEAFRKGTVYCNRIKFYKQMGIDEYEGDIVWAPTLLRDSTGKPAGFFPMHQDSISLQRVQFPLEVVGNMHVFCMFAMYSLGAQSNDFRIPDQCREEFGEHAVLIRNPTEFFHRLESAIFNKALSVGHGLVTYYSGPHPLMTNRMRNRRDERFSISYDPVRSEEAVFFKRLEFQHQKEYRIAIDTHTEGDDHFEIDLGDIGDISSFASTLQLQHISFGVK